MKCVCVYVHDLCVIIITSIVVPVDIVNSFNGSVLLKPLLPRASLSAPPLLSSHTLMHRLAAVPMVTYGICFLSCLVIMHETHRKVKKCVRSVFL